MSTMKNKKTSWYPEVGEETTKLLSSLSIPGDAKESLLNEALDLMALCGSPSLPKHQETGLAFGYVQSGKTMSFTTLTALAKDNGYQVVIIIAGISDNLLDQSTKRLTSDLQLDKREDREWLGVKKNPSLKEFEAIKQVLQSWKDKSLPDEFPRRTVLITVMKNQKRLADLVKLVKQLNMEKVPVLIIDDEGDQASLNTKARKNAMLAEKEQSTIYKRVIDLKSLLPHHTFIQYTATPQANLFVHMLDTLSPNFIRLLTPGKGYVGGETFFIDNKNLVKVIPSGDIPEKETKIESPPESLEEAMQFFFLGVAVGSLQDKEKGNRSMIVHPSRLQEDQRVYFDWVNNIKKHYSFILSEGNEQDRKDLLLAFHTVYKKLEITVKDLPSFEKIANENYLAAAIKRTQIEEVNSRQGKTPLINWGDHYSHILVGGQALDRGFTVEGLTVTYMPRSVGVGNMDTIQQRARFFGYKSDYLGLCRIYLDKNTLDAYNHYIHHEIDLRTSLERNNYDNRHLNDWERQVILDSAYNLARQNIFSHSFEREKWGGGKWLTIDFPQDLPTTIENNRLAVQALLDSSINFSEDKGHEKRTEEQKHFEATCTVEFIYNKFISKLKFTRISDSKTFHLIRSKLKSFLERREGGLEMVSIYLMSKGKARIRQLSKDDKVKQLFQGKNPKSGAIIYPGDREIKNENHITIQIHNLDLKDTSGNIINNVYTIAVWVPPSMREERIIQKEEL